MKRGTGRAAALLLSLVMSVTLTLGAWAAETGSNAEIAGFSDEFGAGGYIQDGREIRHGDIGDFAYLTGTLPGTEIFMPLRVRDFEWAGSSNLPMSPRYVEYLGIEFERVERRGSELFDRIAFVERDGTMGLLIDFVDEWVSVEEREFQYDCRFFAGGQEYAFEIRGTVRNRNRMVYTSTSGTIQLGVGRTATGYADVESVRFDLGCGVSITSDIQFFQSVYGAAKETAREMDTETLEQYPQIVKTIYLDTVNLRGNVRIDPGELGVLHVYSADLTYLGTTAGPLRQEYCYYLATAKL